MVRSFRTTRQDIYKQLVENASSDESSSSDDFIFQYQYELFSLGAVVGFARQERVNIDDEEKGWSQEILKMSSLNPEHEHRVPVDIVNQLVLMELDEDDLDELPEEFDSVEEVDELEDVWELVLRYADAGVEHINEGISVQKDFDLVGTVRDFENPVWRERLRDVVSDPEVRN